MPPPLSTSGHTGWQFQGRRQHGWFGHGTAPDQAVDQNHPEAGRADTAAHAAVGALPAADRARYEALLGAGGLAQLRVALPAWAASLEQTGDAFRARFFGNTVGTETAERFRTAAVAIARAATPQARNSAITALANAISTLGVERFGRVLAQTAAVAANPIQRVADGSAGTNATPVERSYVDANPRRWLGGASVGTGECVPLVQQATGLRFLARGDKVKRCRETRAWHRELR